MVVALASIRLGRNGQRSTTLHRRRPRDCSCCSLRGRLERESDGRMPRRMRLRGFENREPGPRRRRALSSQPIRQLVARSRDLIDLSPNDMRGEERRGRLAQSASTYCHADRDHSGVVVHINVDGYPAPAHWGSLLGGSHRISKAPLVRDRCGEPQDLCVVQRRSHSAAPAPVSSARSVRGPNIGCPLRRRSTKSAIPALVAFRSG